MKAGVERGVWVGFWHRRGLLKPEARASTARASATQSWKLQLIRCPQRALVTRGEQRTAEPLGHWHLFYFPHENCKRFRVCLPEILLLLLQQKLEKHLDIEGTGPMAFFFPYLYLAEETQGWYLGHVAILSFPPFRIWQMVILSGKMLICQGLF